MLAKAPLSANLNLGTQGPSLKSPDSSTILVDFVAKIPLKSHGLPQKHYYAAPVAAGHPTIADGRATQLSSHELPHAGDAGHSRYVLSQFEPAWHSHSTPSPSSYTEQRQTGTPWVLKRHTQQPEPVWGT